MFSPIVQAFRIGQPVLIKKYRGDQYNEQGRVNTYDADTGRYWISNMNMPYMGTVSDMFSEDELENVQ